MNNGGLLDELIPESLELIDWELSQAETDPANGPSRHVHRLAMDEHFEERCD